MTPQFRAFLKVCAAGATLYLLLWAAHIWAVRSVRAFEHCDMPCQADPFKGLDPSCRPIAVTLEVKTVPDPKGRTTVWYRATVRNQSCRRLWFAGLFLTMNTASEFGYPSEEYTHVAVTTEDGKPAPFYAPPDQMDIKTGVGGVQPYRSVNDRLRQYLSSGEDYNFDLAPGAEVQTNYEELAPYRMMMFDTFSKNGDIGTTFKPIPLGIRHPEKIYAVPPEGFRRLVGYDLRRPGRYKARFEFIEPQVILNYYRDPNESTRRRNLREWVFLLADYHPWHWDPVDLSARSNEVDFEVVR